MRSHHFIAVFSAVSTYIVQEVLDTATELAVESRSDSLIFVNTAVGLVTQCSFIFSRILALVSNPPLLQYVM